MKKILIVLAALAAFGATGLYAQSTANDVNIKYNEAAEFVKNKQYAEAIPIFATVIELGMEVGEEAINTVTAAQKALPGIHLQYARTLAMEQNLDEAISQAAMAIETGELYGVRDAVQRGKNLSAQIYKILGGTHFNNKEFEQAVAYFVLGYEIDPTFTDNAIFMGESYAGAGQYEKAFEIFGELIAKGESSSRYAEVAAEASEKMSYYLTLQANELVKAGNIAGAYTLFEQILTANPANPAIQLMRIQTATNAKDWNNVINWAVAAAAAQTDDEGKSNVYFLQGAAYQNSSRPEEAIAAYRKVTAGNNVQTAKSQIELLLK